MAYNGFAIDEYLDAAAVTAQLDALMAAPVHSIRREKLADYVFETPRDPGRSADCVRQRAELIRKNRKLLEEQE